MKNITNKLLAALTLLACALAARAADYKTPSLINGTGLVITNGYTFTNTPWLAGQNLTNAASLVVYTPPLSEQYPVGFGGGTNWWASGWTYYTNSSGIIVTNPLPLLQTNYSWGARAQFYGYPGLAQPTVGCLVQVGGSNNIATNAITITLGSCAGTNFTTAAQDQYSFTFNFAGTNVCVLTNLPSAFVQNADSIYPVSITGIGTNANFYLNQLRLTYWSPSVNE